MTISVVVPTRDRPRLLQDCLDALRVQTRPPLEVIVVDGSAKGATADMVSSLFPRARLIRETAPGVDRARNRGLAEARGEVVAFTDDDCLAPPDWLAALADCFRDPEVVCAGGPTRPLWPAEPPRAFLASRRTLFSLGMLDLGPERKRIDPDREFLAGGNLAVRRCRAGAGFRGLQPIVPPDVSGEDYEFSRRLAREGAVLYEPRACVRHRLDARKLGWLSVLRRLFYCAAVGALLGRRLKPKRGVAELMGWEGAVSAADALGHLYGRLKAGRRFRTR